LDRLGHNGNGVCLPRTLLVWGLSIGSTVNYSKRCVTAMEDALADQVQWPNQEERCIIAAEFAKKGFPGCVGLIDGTTLPLAQRPANHGECYFDRKSRYSVNAQVVCDHKCKILFFYAGEPIFCFCSVKFTFCLPQSFN
jgi:DDE superfamily endonuclease